MPRKTRRLPVRYAHHPRGFNEAAAHAAENRERLGAWWGRDDLALQ